jgi:hypothetical protein
MLKRTVVIVICSFSFMLSSNECVGAGRNDSWFKRWMANPGRVERLVIEIPGDEFIEVQKGKDPIPESGFRYYDCGFQDGSFYYRYLSNSIPENNKSIEIGNVSGVASSKVAWRLFRDNLNREMVVAVQDGVDVPFVTADSGIVASRVVNDWFNAMKACYLGFALVEPKTLVWKTDSEFEYGCLNPGNLKQKAAPARVVVKQFDETFRPTLVEQETDGSEIRSVVRYGYDSNVSDVFPTSIRIDQIFDGKTVASNSVRVVSVKLGGTDLKDGYVPKMFLSDADARSAKLFIHTNGQYIAIQSNGSVDMAYTADDPNRPLDPRVGSRALFYYGAIMFCVVATTIFLRRYTARGKGDKHI